MLAPFLKFKVVEVRWQGALYTCFPDLELLLFPSLLLLPATLGFGLISLETWIRVPHGIRMVSTSGFLIDPMGVKAQRLVAI